MAHVLGRDVLLKRVSGLGGGTKDFKRKLLVKNNKGIT